MRLVDTGSRESKREKKWNAKGKEWKETFLTTPKNLCQPIEGGIAILRKIKEDDVKQRMNKHQGFDSTGL